MADVLIVVSVGRELAHRVLVLLLFSFLFGFYPLEESLS